MDNINEEKQFKIIIPLDYYRKIMAYVDLVETEITGFSECEYDPETHTFRIGEVYLLDQEASGAQVEMSEEKISDFTLQMINSGKTQLPRCWWHSHVNMAVFFSGTDEEAIENLKNETFMLALVVNKRREMRADVVIWKPFYYRWADLPVEIDYSAFDIPETWKREVKDKVKPEKKVEKQSSFNWLPKRGKGKKNKGYFGTGRIVRTLPKDNQEAEQVIWKNNLSERYDDDLGEMVWANGNTVWRDQWDLMRVQPLYGGTNLKIKQIILTEKNKGTLEEEEISGILDSKGKVIYNKDGE